MKTNKLVSSLIAVFTAVVLFAPVQALAAAFGVSPPWIENNNLKPGSNFVYVINLSANDLPDNMLVEARFEGDPEIAEWLTVLNKEKLIMSTGQNIVPMSVLMNIPENARLGRYEGNLRLSLVPQSKPVENIATLLGGNVAVKLNVVNYDVIDYTVRGVSVEPINEGQPVTLKMTLKNDGNTDLNNVMTKGSVISTKTGEVIISNSVSELNVPVRPQTKGDTQVTFPMRGLKAGDYWLEVETFKNSKSIYKNRLSLKVNALDIKNSVDTGVEVMPEGWIKPSAPLEKSAQINVATSVKVRAPIAEELIIVVIGILLVLTGVVVKIYTTIRKKRR